MVFFKQLVFFGLRGFPILNTVSRILALAAAYYLGAFTAFAQTSQAILVNGSGPWQDDRWTSTTDQFTSMLHDAGYAVNIVAPTDVPDALSSGNVLLAVPSLESLPFETLRAISQFLSFGGSIMASGGEPFRDPLYLAPGGAWLDAAAYQSVVGAPPGGSLPIPTIFTLSPWYAQYETSSGTRIPILGPRGLIGQLGPRTRVIGDVLAPAATIYSLFLPVPGQPQNISGERNLVIWLPSPQLADADRAQLVVALRGAITGVHLQGAGPSQIVWLPGEPITGQICAVNMSNTDVPATLQWTISGSSGATAQPSIPVPIAAGAVNFSQLNIPTLPAGDYTLSFHLTVGGQEVDSLESPLRIFDPVLSRQPNQKITVVNGAFYANGQPLYLHGVNYWPRYAAGVSTAISWLDPEFYDPVQVEADLKDLAALNFNLVNIQYVDPQPNSTQQARSLVDFLDRCRNHGIWVRIALPATLGDNAFNGSIDPQLGAYLKAAFLPGNDRVFAYELLWEPYVGMQTQGGYGGYLNGAPFLQNLGRSVLDADWRAWVGDQYGSPANAQQSWGVVPPFDAGGLLISPTDDQFNNDGPWRIMVAAYRRFADDYFSRNLGLVAREIRRIDPDTLLTYRNWAAMTAASNSNMGYDLGTAAAHLDFLSPESYDPAPWPQRRIWGFAAAYSRYRSGGKPVQWVEFGYPVGSEYGTPDSLAAQSSYCDGFMQQVNDDGADADSIWWWPGGLSLANDADFGIVNPDGTPRGCALALAQWGETFRKTPPSAGSGRPATISIDRDADARGQYGLFLNFAGQYAAARASGAPVALTDPGAGTDTSMMPLVQVGNVAYSGIGPLKYANAELGGLHVVCPNLDVTVENGAQLQLPAPGSCRIAATVVNTGEAQWLPASFPTGGVTLHTSSGDTPLAAALPPLERVALDPLIISVGRNATVVTGRMRIGASMEFGEMLRLTLIVNPGSRRPRAPGRIEIEPEQK